jgi:hypothetical protein
MNVNQFIFTFTRCSFISDLFIISLYEIRVLILLGDDTTHTLFVPLIVHLHHPRESCHEPYRKLNINKQLIEEHLIRLRKIIYFTFIRHIMTYFLRKKLLSRRHNTIIEK